MPPTRAETRPLWNACPQLELKLDHCGMHAPDPLHCIFCNLELMSTPCKTYALTVQTISQLHPWETIRIILVLVQLCLICFVLSFVFYFIVEASPLSSLMSSTDHPLYRMSQ